MRLYYIMTLEVHAAINGCGDYSDQQVFMDPAGCAALSGLFSTLYFESLETAIANPTRARASVEGVPTRRAGQLRSTVVENALLGINAHINFDLPRAIAANLDPAEVMRLPEACRSASSTTTR